jgi:hypothetical protein
VKLRWRDQGIEQRLSCSNMAFEPPVVPQTHGSQLLAEAARTNPGAEYALCGPIARSASACKVREWGGRVLAFGL